MLYIANGMLISSFIFIIFVVIGLVSMFITGNEPNSIKEFLLHCAVSNAWFLCACACFYVIGFIADYFWR